MSDETDADTPKVTEASAAASGQQASREIEVKLEADAATMRRLLAVPPLAVALAGVRAQTLASIYFDTAEDALADAGLTLRIRKARAKRIMTLKWTPEGEGLFARGEAEVVLPGDAIDLDLLDSALAARVRAAADGAPLVARYETRIKRRAALVTFGGATLDVAHDDGRILADTRSQTVRELELEWRDGEPDGLHALASRLVDAGARLSPLAKSQRGLMLARDAKASPQRATPPKLHDDAQMEDVIGAVARSCLAQFTANWPSLREDGAVEAIHQARVALRRLRSGLAMFEKALPDGGFRPFRDEAKRIASALGPARDLDSFLALVRGGPAPAMPDETSFAALIAAAERLRVRACAEGQGVIAAPETSRFVLDLEAFIVRRGWRNGLDIDALGALAAPASTFAAQTLDRLDKRARKRGKGLRRLPPEERHELRISLKNLRYGADFFSSLYGEAKGAKAFARALAELQDALGAYNDAVVANGVAAACEAEAGGAASRAAGAVCGWCARGVADADAGLLSAWKRYKKATRYWR